MDPYVRHLEGRIDQLERLVRQLSRQVRMPFAMSRSTAQSVDDGPVQTNQGRLDALSLQDKIPTLYTYGFSSSLPLGGDKVVCFPYGDRSQGIAIATGHQTHRFTGLAEGETVMHDMWGHSIHLTQSGIVITGSVSIVGDLSATGSIIAGKGGSDQVNVQTHKHGTGAAAAGTSAPTPGT